MSSVPPWMRKEIQKYEKRRNEANREDMQFMTATRRAFKVCHNWKQVDTYLRVHIRKANEAEKAGERYLMVLDVEEPRSKKFSWHERQLVYDGVKKEEIEERWRKRESMKGNDDRKGAGRKSANYWRHQREDREFGMSNGRVAAFSLAAVDDEQGDNTFSVHCGNVIGKGEPRMLHRFFCLCNIQPSC